MQDPRNVDETDDRSLVVESEAIKSADEIRDEKKNKAPVSDADLPGYPHYAPEEDILNVSSGMDRVEVDVENITRAGNIADADLGVPPEIPPVNAQEEPVTSDMTDDEDDLGIVPGTEADVTAEDLLLLGPKDRDMDMGEDEELENRGFPLGMTGEDLDVPEADEDQEDSLGQGDEENNYYSLGGDSKEGLEEDRASGY